MSQRAVSRTRGFLSRGALLSLLLHVQLLTPIGVLIWVFGGRQQAARDAQRAQEMDVEFQDVSAAQLPKDLPPIEPPPDQLEPPRPPPPKPKPVARAKKPDQKPAQPQEKPKDEPEKPVLAQPAPKPEPPPPPPERREGHEKIVDQENEKNEPPPPEANYLAQNNHHTAEESRARETTLEKRRHDAKANELPTDEKDRIAELEDQKSALGRKAPEVTPHENPQVAEPEKTNAPKSLLALRDPAPRTHELTPETADPSLPKAADGDIAMARPARGAHADPARLKTGDKVKLALSQKDYEYLFGAEAEAERRLAETHRSTRKGKLAQKVARVQAALENFVPEVRPGNTTDLNTRAAPFAAYIARMHRSIHKLWGFDQLEAWEELSGGSPLNDYKLATTLEAVLNRDGTIDKVALVRSSGYMAFDAAAIDVLYTAGPFPDPPREIRSPDGKIYVHWTFHRDERQCTPAFTQYFILAENPHPKDKGAIVDRPESPHATGGGAAGEASRPAGAARVGEAVGPTGAGAPAPAPGEAPAQPKPTSTAGDDGPRRLRRSEDSRHRATTRKLDEEVAAAEEKAGISPPAPAQSSVARASDPAARAVAERWFKALAVGDASVLASLAVLPFKTSGKDVSKRAALTAMFADLASEEKSSTTRTLEVFTTAGLRAAIGKLPANVDDGSGAQLYALASNGPRDSLILILAKRGTDWKPIGLVRR